MLVVSFRWKCLLIVQCLIWVRFPLGKSITYIFIDKCSLQASRQICTEELVATKVEFKKWHYNLFFVELTQWKLNIVCCWHAYCYMTHDDRVSWMSLYVSTRWPKKTQSYQWMHLYKVYWEGTWICFISLEIVYCTLWWPQIISEVNLMVSGFMPKIGSRRFIVWV